MIFLFALCITLGAFLVKVAGMSLGVIAIIVLAAVGFTALLYRKKELLFASVVFGLAIIVGGFAILRLPVHSITEGNRAIMARAVSVSAGGAERDVVAKDADGARYKFATSERVLPGDELSIRGSIRKPEDFVSDTTGRVVRYESLMQSRRIDATVSFLEVSINNAGKWWLPTRILTQFQIILTNAFGKYIAYPFDAVVSGMVLGVQGGITDAIKNLFLNTGTLHVLVLSGYNITLIAGILGALFRNSRPKVKTLVMFLGIIFLVGVSGAGVAALRAGIMGSLTLIALLARREYNALRALVIAYLLFFFINPLSVFFDPSFHLSFLATFAIIAIYPPLEAKFVKAKTKWKRELQAMLLISIFMPLWMLPYGIYFSGVIAGSSPFANIIAALLVPVITILGLIVLSISWLTPLATIIGSVITILASALLWLLKVSATIPIWNAPPIPWWSVILIYMVLLMIFERGRLQRFIAPPRETADSASLQSSNQSFPENL